MKASLLGGFFVGHRTELCATGNVIKCVYGSVKKAYKYSLIRVVWRDIAALFKVLPQFQLLVPIKR
jgi:hypothetical protein